jgi:hypothetical protein
MVFFVFTGTFEGSAAVGYTAARVAITSKVMGRVMDKVRVIKTDGSGIRRIVGILPQSIPSLQ